MNMVTILMWTTWTMLEVQHVINHIYGKDVTCSCTYLYLWNVHLYVDMWARAQLKIKWCGHLRWQIPSGSKVCNEINTLNEKIQFFAFKKIELLSQITGNWINVIFLKFHKFCCWTPLQLLAPRTKKTSFATTGGL